MPKKFCYDIEVYPNFFCVSFLDIETGIPLTFEISEFLMERDALTRWMRGVNTLIGFNSISYDDPMMRYVLQQIAVEDREINKSIYRMSQRLIAPNSNEDEEIRELRYGRGRHWKQIDLMKMMAFDRLGVSLKQVAINLHWPMIQDLPYSYNHALNESERKIVYSYNKNDTQITFKLYRSLHAELDLREQIGNLYNVDLMSASDSKMANILFTKFYCEKTGDDPKVLKSLRTVRDAIPLRKVISRKIGFKTPFMMSFLAKLENVVVRPENKYAFKEVITFRDLTYEIGIGGLHSKDTPEKFTADEATIIRDADVASYYPNIIINHQIAPEHLDQRSFTEVLSKITHERIEAKKSGDKKKADALKITINSIFGKLSSDTFWLQDMEAFLKVTLQGQLYLLMLIERLTLHEIEVISANTDGIICRFHKSKEARYNQICEGWMKDTGLDLEFTDYKSYIRSDVNDYIAEKTDGTTKEKGRFLRKIDLKKGYKYPIVAEAVYSFLIHGVPIRTTLENCTDILSFCISQKAGSQFQMVLMSHSGEEVLQKNNRFFITNAVGRVLVKRNICTKKKTNMYSGYGVTVLNNYNPEDDYMFEKYDVNLDFYEREAMKIVDPIDPSIKQMEMF